MPSPLVVITLLPACHLGTVVDGRYLLKRLVGEGASSWVFAAADQRLGREVALKLFKPSASEDDIKRRKRCASEGRTLAKLVHPHIVAIHDASEDGAGQAYLVMELCEAVTLESELTRCGQLSPTETLQLMVPLMGALAVAHDRNVVHRDIKPRNIVLLQESDGRRCKLLDFGIASDADASASSALAVGTPSFMAPEQARGEQPTPASDVWAFGVVLFRCLTGRLPFEANSAANLLLKIVSERAPHLSDAWGTSSCRNLALAIDRALEPDLERRYRDMRSFAQAIAAACTLDDLHIGLRPEPIGLPDFDRWQAAAEVVEATRELPSIAIELRSQGSGKRGVMHRSWALLALGGIAAVTIVSAWTAVAPKRAVKSARAVPSSEASERARAQSPAPPIAARDPQEAAASIAARSAPAASNDVDEPSNAVASGASSGSRRARPGKRRAAASTPAPAAVSSEPRVIMDWDW